MREDYLYYTIADGDEKLVRYVIDELRWCLKPLTMDYSNVMAHRARFKHALALAKARGEYNALMGKENSFLAEMASMLELTQEYQIETKRLGRLEVEPLAVAINLAYAENQNLHCFKLDKTATQCLERQTRILRAEREKWTIFKTLEKNK